MATLSAICYEFSRLQHLLQILAQWMLPVMQWMCTKLQETEYDYFDDDNINEIMQIHYDDCESLHEWIQEILAGERSKKYFRNIMDDWNRLKVHFQSIRAMVGRRVSWDALQRDARDRLCNEIKNLVVWKHHEDL